MASESEIWDELGEEILAAPNSDDLRLEFAARLEDQDAENDAEDLFFVNPQYEEITDKNTRRYGAEESNDRALLIRIQLTLAATDPSDSKWMRFATEAENLLLKHEIQWTPDWYGGAGIRDAEFHRGFIECVTVSSQSLSNFGERLFAEAPIRHLDIVELDQPNRLSSLLDQLESGGYLDPMVSLRLDGQNLQDEHLALLNRPALSGLRWLSLAHNKIGYQGAVNLANNLRGLQFLDFHGNPFDPVDQLSFDQGIVIDRVGGLGGQEFPDVPWLTPQIISGLVFYPSRFASIHGYSDESPEAGPAQGPSGEDRRNDGRRSKATAKRVKTVGRFEIA